MRLRGAGVFSWKMTNQYNFSEVWIRSHHIPLYFRKSVFIYIVHYKSLHCCSSDLFISFLSSFFRRLLESRTCKAQTWWFNNWYLLLPQSVTNLKRFWCFMWNLVFLFLFGFIYYFLWGRHGGFFVCLLGFFKALFGNSRGKNLIFKDFFFFWFSKMTQ